MTLRSRLEAAREDYRELPDVEVAVPPRSTSSTTRRRALAAAVIVVLVAGGVALWNRSADDSVVDTGPATGPTKSDDADPPGAIAPSSPDIRLAPSGPYEDGDVVELTVPEGFAEDLPNGGARLCAVLADGPGGPGEWCDPADITVNGQGTSTSVESRVSRLVFTPTGDRDCEDPAVTCRLVVRGARGDVASAVLRFRGVSPTREATIELTSASDDRPGAVTMTATGVTPHPSWEELRATDPGRSENFGPFWVSVCAFGEPEEPTDPWGTNRWLTFGGNQVVPTPDCDTYQPSATIDPDAVAAPVQTELPTWLLTYRGWNDCRSDSCFVLVRRTIVHGFEPGGGLLGSDEVVAATPIEPDLVDPDGARPRLNITTPGPHRSGQAVTIGVSGLRVDRTTSIGVCQVENPWGCGYLSASLEQIGNGTHTVRLPDPLVCPTRCYLELDSQGEGTPPLATAALDTTG